MSAPDNNTTPTAGQSYLSKLSPWSRSPTVAPSKGKNGEPAESKLQQQKGGDHIVTHSHRLSLKKYPKDCPPVRPCWFHAVDVPKRRPNPAAVEGAKEEKPPGVPKKYAAFSVNDSKAIEAAFQKLVDEDSTERHNPSDSTGRPETPANSNALQDEQRPRKIKVPVNEDYLFDVDVERRELAPAYWLGPVYDVRRGTWFYQEGSVQRPCDENLAAQLEEGYLKVKAWRLPSAQAQAQAQNIESAKPRSASQPRVKPASWAETGAEVIAKVAASTQLTPQTSSGNLRGRAANDEVAKDSDAAPKLETNQIEAPMNTHRLFGAHMNSVVTYQDGTTAWLLTDDFISRMNYTMYQRFAGGGHFAGVKMTRGYVNPINANKKPTATEVKDGKDAAKEAIPSSSGDQVEPGEVEEPRPSISSTRRAQLHRQMSSLLEDPSQKADPEAEDEERRLRDEREIEDDYRETEGEEQGREIEHLILVTHGIGQRLGLRLESVNFVHDVNTLRKTLKAVYAESPDLRALNAELGDVKHMNSRVQVLPICWRHLLDFPKQSLKHNRREHDLADADNVDDDEFPSLDDITVEGVAAVRNLITDLALDVLLYQSPAYKEHISRIVLQECNRIYAQFVQRNPTFESKGGKVSMIGHSLGSAIMFDILCRQGEKGQKLSAEDRKKQLNFEVEDFYALGSPIGLFQMLKGKTIAARPDRDAAAASAVWRRRAASSAADAQVDNTGDLGATAPTSSHRRVASLTARETKTSNDPTVSRPQCSQIFNIFHPTDPISYRVEPLISPAMAALKPQPLPYTKRGIFGAPMGQGLTGIGTRVSQSVSSMWSSMASSLLTRGLGYTGQESTRPIGATGTAGATKSSGPLSLGVTNPLTNTSMPTAPLPAEGVEIAPLSRGKNSDPLPSGQQAEDQQHPPTLIEADLETLYAGFQQRQHTLNSDAAKRDLNNADWASTADAEERAKKLRREEEKVRRLNANGRVDYAIQEGVFDINLIAAIASHLSYWSDEDVCHFIVSQLLSRHRIVRPMSTGGSKSQST
ncbi:Hypothetical protein R9X50_00310000 [Acrodontium crateriforme]|uniref:DDHD domain-containing protein n=1 Tax=Acrodontium crateriforme TaxID=150365 RepID=A0AAQ3R3Z8_9PEZI|nr:Hypothetical protein R9X50_00310000 [Acrodontium crateriforme]